MGRIVRLHECDTLEKVNELLRDARFTLYERLVVKTQIRFFVAEWDVARDLQRATREVSA